MRNPRLRQLALRGTVVGGVVLGLMVVPAGASAHVPGHFRGVITANTAGGRALHAKLYGSAARRHRGQAGNNLLYNGGPVMHSDANYSIYWAPSGYSFTSSYQDIIDGFFSNVAADSGTTTNDYSITTQYYDGSGNIAYNSSFGGRINDTDPYPASGCSAGGGECITDAQLQSEVNQVVAANGLPTGLGTIYYVFFPQGVTTCFDSSGSQCSGTTYCAYHSSFGSGSSSTLYANMPYAAISGCDSGESPNGDPADATINVTSHENIEAITDPLGTAWYDASGQEIGDKCAWNFGSPLGGSPGAEFNEQIGSGDYWLQQEWSNAISGCAQHS